MILPNGIVEEFSSRFTQQAGIVHVAESGQQAISMINEIIEQRGKPESCCSPQINLRQNGSTIDISGKLHTTLKFSEFQKQPRKFANSLDVGITQAEYAIAETGAIVDVSFTDEQRLLSSFTRVHIALLEPSRVLPRLADFAPRIREMLGVQSGERRKPAVTLIGGPSRTADIELKQVLGVHGPHEVHVVICK